MSESASADPADKAGLRRAALDRRAGLPATMRDHFADRLVHEGLRLAARAPGRVVSGFWPIRGEPDCRPLLAALAAAGYETALPLVEPVGRALAFRRWRAGDPVHVARFGLTEPAPTCPLVEPDLLLVPCAAFDRGGHRIGYGRGHYDATLAALKRRKAVLAVAIAFSVQEVAAVPPEAHDERVDLIVTEREIIVTASASRPIAGGGPFV
jgi:5-formyltetrahydrofolate cyclo-ligase